MPLQQFNTPGFADDLPADLKDKWGNLIAAWIEKERSNLPAPYAKFFFNELQHPEADKSEVLPIAFRISQCQSNTIAVGSLGEVVYLPGKKIPVSG